MVRKADKSQKQKIRLPFSAIIMYLSLAAILLTGVTYSKYVTGTTTGDAARVAYMKDISIEETGNFTEQNKWIILPGVDMEKNATVRFEGSEMACYIFLHIKTTGWTRKNTNTHAFSCPVDNTEALAWEVSSTWSHLIDDGTGGAVYYCIVSANTTFDAEVLGNNGKITVSPELTRTQLETLTKNLGNELTIDIGAIAVQYHGISDESGYADEKARAQAVWDLVKTK